LGAGPARYGRGALLGRNLPTVGGRADVAIPLPAAPMSRRGGTRRTLTDDDSSRVVAGVEAAPG